MPEQHYHFHVHDDDRTGENPTWVILNRINTLERTLMAALADILTAEQTTESGEITALTAAYQAALATIAQLQATIAGAGLSPADQATVDAIAAAQTTNEAALTAAIPAVTTPVTSPVVTPVDTTPPAAP